MTSTHPTQTVRGAETKDDATILAVWRHGKLDTIDIAARFRTTEAHVYGIIASRLAPSRRDKPQYDKIGYASRPARKSRS